MLATSSMLGETLLEEASGNSTSAWEEATNENTDWGKRRHIYSKGTVRTASSIFFSGKLVLKLPEIAEDLILKMGRAKERLKFKDVAEATDALQDNLNQLLDKIKSLPDEGKKFLDDFAEAETNVLELFLLNPELVEAWRFLDEAGVDETLRRNIDALADPDAALDAIQMFQKVKPTWPEIQALFKRGNDFNKKGRLKYTDDFVEVVLRGVDGKPGKRLDTYIPPSGGKAGEIISRKATTLSEIQPNTFRIYLNELVTKYPKGAELNSSKFPSGTTLNGDYFLEIPTSNKSFFESSSEFQQVLSDFNTSKGVDIKSNI